MYSTLFDLETVRSKSRCALRRMLGKLTRKHALHAEDIRAVLAAGVSRAQIEDALAVCFAFNTMACLADAFAFFVPGPEAFDAGAKYLLMRGYR